MNEEQLFQSGYYHYYFDYTYKGDKYKAQAEFGPDNKLVSVLLGNVNEYEQWEFIDENGYELFDKDLGEKCVKQITKNWIKEINNGRV